MDRNVIGYL